MIEGENEFMTDVLFYQNYTYVADISAIVLCIICWLLLHSSYTVREKSLIIFKAGTVCLMMATVCSISFHTAITRITESRKILIYVLQDGIYLLLILTFVLLCNYFGTLLKLEERPARLLGAVSWGGYAVFAFLEIGSPFTHLGFYIDADLMVHQNFYFDPFRFAYIYYCIVLVVVLFTYRKKFVLKMLRCLAYILLFSFGMIALEAEYVSTSYSCMALLLPYMGVLFLFHYTSYDRETGTLDAGAFDSYLRDVGDDDFSVIFMGFPETNLKKIPELPRTILTFAENYFKTFCLFRLQDDKLALVYQRLSNKAEKNGKYNIQKTFERVCKEHGLGYRVLIAHADDRLREAGEYLALNEFMEEKIPVGAVYECQNKDIIEYRKASYILGELKDINAHCDLEDERVKVYCQPVLNTRTNRFASAEALMRLELPETGMVYPDQFIPMAERHDYIHTLSKIILNKTCRQIKRLEQEGYEIDRVSVNFSILEFRRKEFCKDVMDIICQNEIPYEKVAIELTESWNETEFDNIKNTITSLQKLGIKFYLDDFGTGYSNFERIIGLPIDVIKFDRSLTILAGKNAESRYMVGSFSDIFKNSHYEILFEGVENEKDEDQCKQMNALYLQGYKYSKPIPIEELTRFLGRAV